MRVAAPLLKAGVAAGRGGVNAGGGDGGGSGGGGGAAAGDWLTRLEAEVLEARPVGGGGVEGVDGGEGTDEMIEVKGKGEEGTWAWGGVCGRYSLADVFVAGAVDLKQTSGLLRLGEDSILAT